MKKHSPTPVMDSTAATADQTAAPASQSGPSTAAQPPSELDLARQRISELETENARLTALVQSLRRAMQEAENAKAAAAADEEVIQRKMSLGLSREQAVAVIRRQREHDAMLFTHKS